ncbi:Hypothetical predicted protein [Octopus vulgaris]|uniref:Uncharacterized protein n=1 Tax=Octopus vulgaris TaxID=6645 RepID=A0AA36BC36_OCTVU|nr:Hypothetical predicted protein [Octopus vulgaris]
MELFEIDASLKDIPIPPKDAFLKELSTEIAEDILTNNNMNNADDADDEDAEDNEQTRVDLHDNIGN